MNKEEHSFKMIGFDIKDGLIDVCIHVEPFDRDWFITLDNNELWEYIEKNEFNIQTIADPKKKKQNSNMLSEDPDFYTIDVTYDVDEFFEEKKLKTLAHEAIYSYLDELLFTPIHNQKLLISKQAYK